MPVNVKPEWEQGEVLLAHEVEPQRERHQGSALPIRLCLRRFGRLFNPQLGARQVIDVKVHRRLGELLAQLETTQALHDLWGRGEGGREGRNPGHGRPGYAQAQPQPRCRPSAVPLDG